MVKLKEAEEPSDIWEGVSFKQRNYPKALDNLIRVIGKRNFKRNDKALKLLS